MNYFRAESDYSIKSDEGEKEMKYSNLIPKFLKKPYEVISTEHGTSMSQRISSCSQIQYKFKQLSPVKPTIMISQSKVDKTYNGTSPQKTTNQFSEKKVDSVISEVDRSQTYHSKIRDAKQMSQNSISRNSSRSSNIGSASERQIKKQQAQNTRRKFRGITELKPLQQYEIESSVNQHSNRKPRKQIHVSQVVTNQQDHEYIISKVNKLKHFMIDRNPERMNRHSSQKQSINSKGSTPRSILRSSQSVDSQRSGGSKLSLQSLGSARKVTFGFTQDQFQKMKDQEQQKSNSPIKKPKSKLTKQKTRLK